MGCGCGEKAKAARAARLAARQAAKEAQDDTQAQTASADPPLWSGKKKPVT